MPLLDASALDQDLEQLASLFRLLSDKTRLNILLSLAKGERNVKAVSHRETEKVRLRDAHDLFQLALDNDGAVHAEVAPAHLTLPKGVADHSFRSGTRALVLGQQQPAPPGSYTQHVE